jgi:hypothetical protein
MQDRVIPTELAAAGTSARALSTSDAVPTGFHVALDTMDARRFRAHPNEVRIQGFALLDTGDYEPIVALVPLQLFWRMQGMDILAHTRHANRERRARPRRLPVAGSVWMVDAILLGRLCETRGDAAAEAEGTGGGSQCVTPAAPRSLRICAVHALDRVALEKRGPRFIERIDLHTMLPRFASDAP